MNYQKLTAVAVFVASAVVAAALTTEVHGFALSPALRYYLTLLQAGFTAALLFLPRLGEKDVLPPHG